MLWRRSEQQLSLRYTTLISDGDAKTHSLLCHEDPYDGAAIETHDCVCHVQMASDGVSTAEEGGCLLQEEEGVNWLRRKGGDLQRQSWTACKIIMETPSEEMCKT